MSTNAKYSFLILGLLLLATQAIGQTSPLTDAPVPDGLYVWPSPSDGIIYITLGTNEEGPYPFELIDLKGRRIRSGLWEKPLNHRYWELNLTRLSAGIYGLIVRKNDKIYHRKILIK